LRSITKIFTKPLKQIKDLEVIAENWLLKSKYSIDFDQQTLPIHIEDLPSDFFQYSQASIQAKCSSFYCAKLKNGKYVSINGQDAIVYNNMILEPLAFKNSYFGLPEDWKHPVLRGMTAPKAKKLNGSALVLSTIGAGQNYGHWIIDLLPRLGFAKHFGFDFDKVDHILINKAIYPFQKELIDLVGIPKEKIIETEADDHIQADLLIVPSNSHHSMFGFEFIRETLIPEKLSNRNIKSDRRIYLSRRNDKHRKIINEEALIELLEKYNFEVVELRDYTISEQIEIMSNTSFLISAQGSGLVNVIYLNEGSNVIEIFDEEEIHTTFYIYGLYNKLNYGAILGKPVENPNEKRANIWIDLSKIELMLEKMQINRKII
jgi:capsular polysaccharide biosynthesis protein